MLPCALLQGRQRFCGRLKGSLVLPGGLLASPLKAAPSLLHGTGGKRDTWKRVVGLLVGSAWGRAEGRGLSAQRVGWHKVWSTHQNESGAFLLGIIHSLFIYLFFPKHKQHIAFPAGTKMFPLSISKNSFGFPRKYTLLKDTLSSKSK